MIQRWFPGLILSALVGGGLAAAQEAEIVIHADQVSGRVSRYLTGACIEDVNHEIYGGLYSQMIFGESFQEPPPAVAPKGFAAYGGRWQIRDGVLRADAGDGPKLIADAPVVGTGTVGVEILLPEFRSGNAELTSSRPANPVSVPTSSPPTKSPWNPVGGWCWAVTARTGSRFATCPARCEPISEYRWWSDWRAPPWKCWWMARASSPTRTGNIPLRPAILIMEEKWTPGEGTRPTRGRFCAGCRPVPSPGVHFSSIMRIAVTRVTFGCAQIIRPAYSLHWRARTEQSSTPRLPRE